MKVECPKCGLTSQIDKNKIPDKGVYLRCKKCTNRFFLKKSSNKNGSNKIQNKDQILNFNRCPKCRIRYPVSHTNCSKCGLKFKPNSSNTTDASITSANSSLSPPSNTLKKRLMLMVSISVVIIMCVLIYSQSTMSGSIQLTQDSYTKAQFDQDFVNWNKNKLIKDYYTFGKSSTKWDADVENALIKYAVYLAGKSDDLYCDELLQDLQQIIRSGCNDPMVTYFFSNMTFWVAGPTKAEPLVKKTLTLLENSTYPPYYSYSAANRLISTYESLEYDDEKTLDILYEKKMKYLARAAADDWYKKNNQRFYSRTFLNEWFDCCELPRGASSFMVEYETIDNVDPWIDLIIRGKYHESKGWEARGIEFANKVTQVGWTTFKQELDMAGNYLTKAYNLHPEFPEAATLMIGIKMASSYGTVSEKEWFYKALNAQFDYMSAYNKYIWSLRPRWGGSHKKMLDFGILCLNTERFDTDVPEMFLRSLRDVASEQSSKNWKKPFRRFGTYKRIKKYFNGILKDPSREMDYFHHLSSSVFYAWACGKYNDAKETRAMLGNDFIAEVSECMSINPVAFATDLEYR